MAQKDMTIILGGVVLPYPSDYEENTTQNDQDIETLGGGMYTDFINIRRSWKISWNRIKEEDHAIIRNLFDSQYETKTYLPFQFDSFGIYTSVKMNFPKKIKHMYNGVIISGLSIELIEQNGIS